MIYSILITESARSMLDAMQDRRLKAPSEIELRNSHITPNNKESLWLDH